MERKIVINFRWWRKDKKRVKSAHVEALEARAWEQITEMAAQGFTLGTLTDNIHMKGDPENGIEYCGYWELENEDAA
jgi:hypothetical protein